MTDFITHPAKHFDNAPNQAGRRHVRWLMTLCCFALPLTTAFLLTDSPTATAKSLVTIPSAQPQTLLQQEPTRLQLPDPIVTSQTSFEIPFNTDDNDGRLIEVQLYVSTDLGRTWNLYSRQSPQAKKIPFQSVGDGEYLFALKTLDRDRNLVPNGPPIPTLRIAIDTAKPELRLQIDPDKEGRVAATWQAMDANLDPKSLSLSYRIAETGAPANWLPVPTGTSVNDKRQATPNVHQDRVVWWPDTSANAIVIKAEIKDHAGNLATVVQPVGLSAFRPTPQTNPTATASTLAPPDPTLVGHQANVAYKPAASKTKTPTSEPIPWPVDGNRPSASPVGNLAYQSSKSRWVDQDSALEGTFANPFATQDDENAKLRDANGLNNMMVAEGSTLNQNELAPQQPTLADRKSEFIPQSALAAIRSNTSTQKSSATENPPLFNSDQTAAGVQSNFASHSLNPSNNDRSSNHRHSFSDQHNNSLDREQTSNANAGADANSNSKRSQSSQFQFAPGTYFIVNQKQFRLRYHVDGLSPDLIGSVAIFGSTDMGKTWRLWTTDQDKTSPVSIDVPDQGRFAFRVVVTNLGGLASEIPSENTQPELVVDVDLTSPTPRIVAAPYGKDPSKASLNIQWQCFDRDLNDAPIAIAYSDSPRGPWTTIVKGASNTGSFSWMLHPNLPNQVYLRMAATDKAGNKGFHQLPDAINLAPLIPHGRILGLEK